MSENTGPQATEGANMPAEWHTAYFPSGTTIVRRYAPGDEDLPHLYVYGPKLADEAEAERMRHVYCEELRDWLNGGTQPLWLQGMRETEYADRFDHPNGASVMVTGPMTQDPPGSGRWVTCESSAAVVRRLELRDILVNGIAAARKAAGIPPWTSGTSCVAVPHDMQRAIQVLRETATAELCDAYIGSFEEPHQAVAEVIRGRIKNALAVKDPDGFGRWMADGLPDDPRPYFQPKDKS